MLILCRYLLSCCIYWLCPRPTRIRWRTRASWACRASWAASTWTTRPPPPSPWSRTTTQVALHPAWPLEVKIMEVECLCIWNCQDCSLTPAPYLIYNRICHSCSLVEENWTMHEPRDSWRSILTWIPPLIGSSIPVLCRPEVLHRPSMLRFKHTFFEFENKTLCPLSIHFQDIKTLLIKFFRIWTVVSITFTVLKWKF